MPVSLAPPKRKQPSEAEIEKVISKGGQVAQTEPEDDDAVVHINTRLTRRIVRQIDALRASRPRKMGSPKLGVSLRDWIVEAVEEKLSRDTKAARR